MSTYLRRIQKATTLVAHAIDELGNQHRYYFEHLNDQLNMLFTRFAPFKAGDRVRLIVDPDIRKSPGWRGLTHFLKAGAEGIVHDVDTSGSEFVAQVVFDDETWIDEKGERQPVHLKHYYQFFEGELEVMDSPAPEAAETD